MDFASYLLRQENSQKYNFANYNFFQTGGRGIFSVEITSLRVTATIIPSHPLGTPLKPFFQ
jgi:hypothetical protein